MNQSPTTESSPSKNSSNSSNIDSTAEQTDNLSTNDTKKSSNSTITSESSSKMSKNSSKLETTEALSAGLLAQFTSLKDLEKQLEQIVENQKTLIENMVAMNSFYTAENEELIEVQLMMKKMNLYRMKLKKIRSDMLYIRSTSQSLLQKAIDLQNIKVNQKAERVKRFDYEIGLIAKSKQQS